MVDKIIPFGSAGIALVDYCNGNGYIQYAGSIVKKEFQKKSVRVYNKVLKSPNFNNPDAVAITGTGVGGVLDGSIKINVKNVLFALE